MTEEVQPVAEAMTEPTAAQTTPEEVKQVVTEEVKQEAKTFTQEELDAIVGKRLAREQRKWEREQQQRIEEPKESHKGELKLDQFSSPEEYAEALAERKAEEKLRTRENQRRSNEVVSQFQEREEKAIDKYEDYHQVAYNKSLPITDAMAEAIRESDIGPDVAYYLGTNPKEADRISRLSPSLQLKEMGKLEAKIEAEPPKVKKTSSAPEPINPVRPKNSTPSYDLDDPRALKEMGTTAWIEAKRQAKIKELSRKG